MRFGFIVYPEVQLMDLVGPVEVLNIWQKIDPALEIIYVAENLDLIECGSGFTLSVDYTFSDAPQLDYMCVPGGHGRLKQMHNPKMLQFIKDQSIGCKLITAICTGAFLLYSAGILTNHEVTTYWLALPELSKKKDVAISEKRVVKSGKIWTSGGISSGIDLMFELICEISGERVAGQVQLLFEYFPNHRIYSTEDDINNLPKYPTENSDDVRRLPKYIDECMNKKLGYKI